MNEKKGSLICAFSSNIGIGFCLIGFGYLLAYGIFSIILGIFSIALAFISDYFSKKYYFEAFKEGKK